jgi:broad specificity phosphatase PhoE
MTVEIVFETHSTTEDNETGFATGWLPGRLSAVGREQAAALGGRRRGTVDAVFTSDLRRAVETVEIAFAGTGTPVLHDWRLRECDYGDLNGAARDVVLGDRAARLSTPYPGGESWHEAVTRVAGLLRDLPVRWSGARVLVVGHVATHWSLEHHLAGARLDDLARDEFVWREGWEYRLDAPTPRP